jgi:hypothetical protein
MNMKRRDFLKTSAGLIIGLSLPLPAVFIPPREPFVRFSKGLDNLYSHLGILPVSEELNVCEGNLLEIGKWDGIGYPCLIRNACCFSKNPPQVWVYDFDLWNFRHDDHLGLWTRHSEAENFRNHASWYAYRRFGEDWQRIAIQGGGWLGQRINIILNPKSEIRNPK